MALGGALGLGLVARDAAALCVAGAAQTHIYRRFPWQSWHKLTSTFFLRGRRGTNSHLPSFCVAAVALMALGGALGLGLVVAGVALMALGGALGLGFVARDAAALCVEGAAQTHLPSFCVAGVAQTHIYHRFAWQAWHRWHWVARLVLV